MRNYFKNERLYARLADFLRALIAREQIDIVHGQHVLTCLPSIDAARRAGVPVGLHGARLLAGLLLVRSDPHDRDDSALCPGCSAAMMTRCIRPRAGALWPLALPMIPYMRANLARKRRAWRGADAIIAVSSTIAADLRARAPELAATRAARSIPNPVDIAGLRAPADALRAADGRAVRALPRQARAEQGHVAPGRRSPSAPQLDWPLVIAGDGPERDADRGRRARAPVATCG